MTEVRVELVDPQGQLLKEIANPWITVKSITLTYAWALRSSERANLDWPKINRAILDRWSASSLDKIKRDAWRKVQS